MQNFRALGAPPPDPQNSPPFANFWLRAWADHKVLTNIVASGGSRKFWWGGIWSQNLKNSNVFTKIETDFSAEIGNSNVFFARNQVVSKKKKKKKKKKNNKRSSPKLRLIFRPDSLRLGRWGGCIPKWSRIIQNKGWFFGQNRNF